MRKVVLSELLEEMGISFAATSNKSDQLAAEEAQCPYCGHQGLRYYPGRCQNQLVAIAECPRCGHSEAF